LATLNVDDLALAKVIVVGRLAEMGALEESFPVFDAPQKSVAFGQDRGESFGRSRSARQDDRLRPWVVGSFSW